MKKYNTHTYAHECARPHGLFAINIIWFYSTFFFFLLYVHATAWSIVFSTIRLSRERRSLGEAREVRHTLANRRMPANCSWG